MIKSHGDDHNVIKGLLGEEKRQNPMELKAKV
jgi:hypothetical protein